MKKILLIIFFILLLFLVSLFVYNNNIKIIICGLNKNIDGPIGDLRYRINFLGIIPAGEAVFEARETEKYQGRQVYHLSARAKSLDIFAKFFKANAMIDSYLDTEHFNPLLFRQKLMITGRADVLKEVFYDQKEGVMTIAATRRQILPNTQDPLSAIFNLRRMDFTQVKEFEMNLNTNQKNYVLKATVATRDISVGNKFYQTVTIKGGISRRDKNPYHKSQVSLVLLKGEQNENIPVLMKVFASGAFICARLIDIQ